MILVGGSSKAYSSLLAFLALPTSSRTTQGRGAPYLYSGPSPVASLATVLAGFKVNEQRGDAIRKNLHRKTAASWTACGTWTCIHPTSPVSRSSRSHSPNQTGIKEVGNYLFDRGIYVTMAAYPLVPRHEVGFRVQVTAANSDAEIAQLIEVLHEVSQRFPLQRASGSRVEHRSQGRMLEVIER